MEKNKKAISPVISTVLLISLAIMLALIVLLWARGFFSEQIEKDGKNIENVCKEAKIDVLYEKSPNGLKIKIKNIGSIPIGAVEIREEGKNTKTNQYNTSVNPGMISSEINYVIVNQDLTQIRIYPTLLGNVKGKNTNKFSACLTNSKVIKRQNIF